MIGKSIVKNRQVNHKMRDEIKMFCIFLSYLKDHVEKFSKKK